MAQRAQPIGAGGWAGAAVAALLLALTLGTVAAVALRAEGAARLGAADWAAVRFTLLQSLLSAVFSVGLAVPAARALARRRFAGRRLLITLLGAPFILPVIVAVIGLLAVFGRGGLINSALVWAGLEPVSIYGLHGVVLAHVFFNLPLATRLILQGWQAIPAERFRLAASLGFSARDVNRWLERPVLFRVLPGAFVVIFVICLTSFAVALTLGGGPRATTVELAIYQAFRFEFDLGRAALLALVQFGLTAVAAVLAFGVVMPTVSVAGLDRAPLRWDARDLGARMVDAAWLLMVSVFLLTPLVMVALRGAPGLAGLPGSVYVAALRSILTALGAAALTLAMALPLALAAARFGRGVAGAAVELSGTLAIAASPLVLGTGLFIVLFPLLDPALLALPVTALVNAVMSLPFAMRALLPAVREAETSFGRLAESLGMSGRARLWLVLLPRLRRPIGFSAGLAAALSMGDLGVIALFANPETATLPLQLYRLMGAYRMEAAAGAGLLLLALSLGLFWLFDRGGRGDAAV